MGFLRKPVLGSRRARIEEDEVRKGYRALGVMLFAAVAGMAILFGIGFYAPGIARGKGLLSSAAAHNSRLCPSLRLALTKVPAPFEANRGQTNPRVKFLSHGPGYTLFLTETQAVLSLTEPDAKSGHGGRAVRQQLPGSMAKSSETTDAVRLAFEGANPKAQVAGLGELPGKSNYFIGNNPLRWRTGVPNYSRVEYRSVYPGINLVYHGNRGRLEFDFVVAPKADPSAIRLAVQGERAGLEVEKNGDLAIRTKAGEVRFLKPAVFQETGTHRKYLHGRFVRLAKNEIGFRVGGYNRAKPLVIDPVLTYSTFLGGSGGDAATGIAVNSHGAVYVVGSTGSTNFPTTFGSYKVANSGGEDVFIAKLNPAASGSAQLIYSTYLGGSADDFGTGIAIDSSGDAFVTGSTASTDFPTTSAAFQTTFGGGNTDAFITELGPAGGGLVFSSYLGGSGDDYGTAVTVDSSGNAYVTGNTDSPNFPVVNPLQGGLNGAIDAFVTEINSTKTPPLLYSTYLGGSASDFGQGIAVDSSGDIYVTGYTYSSDFPTQNALYPNLLSSTSANAFVSELKAGGASLVFSTYLGGAGTDRGLAIALDGSNNIYVAGDTTSANLPVTTGVVQSVYKATSPNTNGFVAKLAAGGASLGYLTYLGGDTNDSISGLAVDSSGDAYVTGATQSASGFPTADALQPAFDSGTCGTAPCSDAFVSVLNPTGESFLYSTYLGGEYADLGNAIAVGQGTPPDNVYIAGSTASGGSASPPFPITSGAYQTTYGGSSTSGNAFIAEIAPTDNAGLALTPQKLAFPNTGQGQTSATQPVTITDAGSAPLQVASISTVTDFGETDNCRNTTIQPGGTCTIQFFFAPPSGDTGTNNGQFTITSNGGNGIVTVSGTVVGSTATGSITPLIWQSQSLLYGQTGTLANGTAQKFTLASTGSQPLDITDVSVGSDFTILSNGCPLDSSSIGTPTLAVGDTCSITVAFSPITTGNLTGSLTVTDKPSPQKAALAGTGLAEYILSASPNSKTIVIGTGSTTFTVNAAEVQGVTNFAESISLACGAGTGTSPTCAFNPPTITAGQSSTLTASGFAANLAIAKDTNTFTVNGTSSSSSQKASVPLSVFLSDFTISSSPSINPVAVTAGGTATYTITANGINGFSEPVKLGCPGQIQESTQTLQALPSGMSCSFSPAVITPSGNTPATSTLTISTTARTSCSELPPGGWPSLPGSPSAPLVLSFLAAWLALAGFAAWRIRRARLMPGKGGVRWALGAMLGAVLLSLAFVSCGTTATQICGTPANTYQIQINGTTTAGGASVVRSNFSTPLYIDVQ